MKKTILFLALLLLVAGAASAQWLANVGAIKANAISLTTPNAMTVGDADQTMTCTSRGGTSWAAAPPTNATYTSNTTSYCTIVSNKLHAVAAGTCTVTAADTGGLGWGPAVSATSGNVTISAAASGPTFVAEYPTAYNTTTTPKTAMNAVTVNQGDVLVAIAAQENNDVVDITENGTASWVQQQSYSASNYCYISVWTYTVTAASEALTVTFTSAYSKNFGGTVLRFSNTTGVGTSGVNHGTSTASSIALTSVTANSVIVQAYADYNAVTNNATACTSSTTPCVGAGSSYTAKTAYNGDGAIYGVYLGYYSVTAGGSVTTGYTGPASRQWSQVSLEVKP
jgi:hypothetical protein